MDPISAALNLGGQLIDRLIPDPTAKAAAQYQLLQLAQSGQLAELTADTDLAKGQLTTNAAEASNASPFVSGWRPFIGWICGFGLGYQFIAAPFMTFGAAAFGHPIVAPTLDLGTLMTLLLGMLGLGGMRTYEKTQGVVSPQVGK